MGRQKQRQFPMADSRELLDRLETRHDELIRKLDELNAEIESALAQFGKPAKEASSPLEVPAEIRSAEPIAKRRAA
jgi:hypothetical protein